MNKLVQVKKLINKCSIEELRTLKEYFVKDENQNSKSFKLYEILCSNETLNYNEIQKYLYTGDNYHAFNKLLNRFEEKILDCISLDLSIRKTKSYNNRNRILFLLRKSLIQADILQLRGDRDYPESIYKKVINESRKLEFYDIELQALLSYERLITAYTQKRIQLEKQIRISQNCFDLLNKSRSEYNKIISKANKSINPIDYFNEIKLSVDKLSEYYSITNSALIGYYYFTLKVELEQNKADYKLAEKSLINLKEIILNHESVYTSNRYGTVLINLANNCLFLQKENEASQIGIESKKYFKGLSFTNLIVDEIIFFSYLYQEKIEESQSILEDMLQSSFSQNKVLYNKFLYYKACLEFKNQNYLECRRILNEVDKNEFEKVDVYIFSRFLLLMLFVETNDLDQFELNLQALDKYIKRNKKKTENIERIKIVVKMLTILMNSNFSFMKISNSNKFLKLFAQTELNAGDFSWKIKSPELIKFNKWIKSKF